MCEMLEQMRDEAMERGIERKLIDDVRSLMETLQLTARQALDALRVPEADQPRYLAML